MCVCVCVHAFGFLNALVYSAVLLAIHVSVSHLIGQIRSLVYGDIIRYHMETYLNLESDVLNTRI